jgi:MFS family permease
MATTATTENIPDIGPAEGEERVSIETSVAEELNQNDNAPSSLVFVVVLIAICFISINNYFCYHEPSAIALQFEDFYSLSTEDFGTLFTIYSAPNVILVFFSGQFIDQFGLRRSSLVFNGLILLGMLLGAVLPSPKDPSTSLSPNLIYVLLLTSRLVLGLGGESICACVSTMISRWFSSTNHLNTAMALNQANVQLWGSAAAFYILPNVESIPAAQWITVVVCVISLCANLLYNTFDTVYQDYLVQVNEVKECQPVQHYGDNESHHQYDPVKQTDDCQLSHRHDDHHSHENEQATETEEAGAAHCHGHESHANDHSASLRATSSSSLLSHSQSEEDGTELESLLPSNPNHTIQIKEEEKKEQSHGVLMVLKKFPAIFWLLLLHISLVSPILYTFTAFGPMYLQETFPSTSSAKDAGDAISLLYMSIMAAPFTGMVIDYIGYRSYVQFFASSNIPLIFILLTKGLLDPKVCMVWMGVIFSITESNGMALISLTVPSHLTGTAFGIYSCCISIALLLEPASLGYIRELTGSFALSIWIFTGLTLLGTITAFFVIVYDHYHGKIISKPASHESL